jgi:hypothetical protein
MHLRNEAHAEFHRTVNALIVEKNPADLEIATEYAAYKSACDKEITLLDIVRTSKYTQDINEQDKKRDGIYRGFAYAVQSALEDFDPDKRGAAKHIHLVLQHYGNLGRKPFDQETAAIDDLLRELQYAPDTIPPEDGHDSRAASPVETLGLRSWLDELYAANRQFKTLMQARYDEAAHRPAEQMRATRREVDQAYYKVIERIEALETIRGEGIHRAFADELNAVASRYRNILARQAGNRQTQ